MQWGGAMNLMRALAAAAAFVCLGTSAARAQWNVSTGEDAMTDKKWVTMSTISNAGPFEIRCSEDGHATVMIVIGRYDDSYKTRVMTTKFRADKDEPFDVFMVPINFNGMLAMVTADQYAMPVLKGVAGAGARVVFTFATGTLLFTLTFHPSGAAKAAETLYRICKLPKE